MKNIQKISPFVGRSTYYGIAGVLLLASIILALPLQAHAAQVSSRSLTMSDSGPSGGTITTGIGSGTNVAYKVAFTVGTASAVGGIVIDFCSNSALSFDTCTTPTSFNANSASNSISNQTNLGAGAFSIYTTSPVASRIIITRGTAATPSGVSSFELGNGTTNGFTNPSTTGSFYARIYTYDTAAHAQAHSQTAATGGEIDFGGVALSTVNVITVTARVQEQLTFCVFKAAPTAVGCTGGTLGTPALTIGHGTTKIIDSSAIDSDTAYSQVNTNAASGVVVRMHNANSCGGLSSDAGVTCGIPPASAGASTAALQTAGTAFFGLIVGTSSTVGSGTGTVTAGAPYNSATANYYGMDTTTSGANTVTTYGGAVESCAGPVSGVNNLWTFGATASPVTPAGLYTANLSVIATGTF